MAHPTLHDRSHSHRIAVIFDMDGVLIDSGAAHLESWRVLAREQGLTVTPAQFQSQFGRPSRDIIRALFGADLDDAIVCRLDERKEAIYRDLVRGRIREIPGAADVVRALRRENIPVAVASSGPPENIALALDELHLADCFAAVVTGMDVPHGKPDPAPFLLAAERLSAPPAACVVIEDAPAGVEAARRAGMSVIALIGSHDRAALAAATLIVDDLAAVTAPLVRRLLAR